VAMGWAVADLTVLFAFVVTRPPLTVKLAIKLRIKLKTYKLLHNCCTTIAALISILL